jgi:FtsZ-interacting cell division protein ZipA
MKDIMPLIQALIVGLLALIGIVLTQTWTTRREYAKRKIEFAEEVLALFYEVSDALQSIRSPLSGGAEGTSRPRSEHESESESRILDNAYVVIERYKKQEAVFHNLRSKKYRFMAIFRGRSHDPFEDITNALNKVFVASHMLGSHYWQRQGRVHMEPTEFQRHLDKMHEQEAIFWMIPDEDPITPIVDGAIKKVEAITNAAAKEYVNPIDWWERWKTFVEDRPQAKT